MPVRLPQLATRRAQPHRCDRSDGRLLGRCPIRSRVLKTVADVMVIAVSVTA